MARADRAPFRSSNALVATVVPMRIHCAGDKVTAGRVRGRPPTGHRDAVNHHPFPSILVFQASYLNVIGGDGVGRNRRRIAAVNFRLCGPVGREDAPDALARGVVVLLGIPRKKLENAGSTRRVLRIDV